jgi:hypothetical protein
MDALKRSWIISMAAGSAIGVLMCCISIVVLHTREDRAGVIAWIITALFFAFVVGCLWQWFRFLRGRALFQGKFYVSPNSGELIVPEFDGDCELWLFSGGWFTRYHGDIHLSTSTGGRHLRKLSDRITVRGNPAPLVWRLPRRPTGNIGTARLSFHLAPNTVLELIRGHERVECIQPVTVLIKAV